ncbi:MAG: ribonuclease Y [Candidatus Levybacteria bacterium CG_4_10_14_0_2_um_filter_36_16]|nr:MAG: ribonuclease Y [Candidatus Levybacteria bacterium CG2_30_37_29]PIZ97094.1 MAG: ribonuclease Y [Candidatus Levybacteria bacterium CG_4_10_14_0_2_um_filter_36_16]
MDDKQKYVKKLEEISHISTDEAKRLLLEEIRNDSKGEIAQIIKESEEEARATAHRKSQEILVDAMRHGALDYIAEYTVSTIKIQDEDVKGRIIGKEGRNIRAFENATGVDVDLDEEGIIRLSSFDTVRREIARRALELLIKDTRIQPVRIEEIVTQTKKEVEQILFDEGEKLAHEVKAFNLHPDLIALLGRFKFRTSFGQNLVVHTEEVTKIGVQLALEIGANEEIVRLGCLFHDIGKIVSEKEGSHVALGVELLQKYKIAREIINCVAEHHEDKPFSSLESILVHVADSISGARPGARHEDVEGYVKRIREMEEIAKGFDGVDDAYAFEAGRELRVVINPGKLDDIETTIVAKNIKEEIDKKLVIPGVVRVTAIREFRTTEPKE